jgi:hypothetical protein
VTLKHAAQRAVEELSAVAELAAEGGREGHWRGRWEHESDRAGRATERRAISGWAQAPPPAVERSRLSLAPAQGCVRPQLAAPLGGADEAGDQLKHCAVQAGMGKNTTVHCVGEGAPWIADQVERVFGAQGHFVVDFYPLCDYVSAAATRCAPEAPRRWFEEQKQRLKQGRVDEVLAALYPHHKPAATPDAKAPVRRCYRYITNRPGQFDYPAALAAGLPLGSGKIESAHRSVIQNRLKIAGAWWKPENAHCMLALCVNRANGAWNNYWSQQELKQAA